MGQQSLFDLTQYYQEKEATKPQPSKDDGWGQEGLGFSVTMPTVRNLAYLKGPDRKTNVYSIDEMAEKLEVSVEKCKALIVTGVLGFTAKEGDTFTFAENVYSANIARFNQLFTDGYVIRIKRTRRRKDPTPWQVICQGDVRSLHPTAAKAREEALARVNQFSTILNWRVTKQPAMDHWTVTPPLSWLGHTKN